MVGKVWNVVSPQYALLARGTFYNICLENPRWRMLICSLCSICDDFT